MEKEEEVRKTAEVDSGIQKEEAEERGMKWNADRDSGTEEGGGTLQLKLLIYLWLTHVNN